MNRIPIVRKERFVSEVVALKVSGIDSKRMVIRIEQGEGRNRYAMLSSSQSLTLLRAAAGRMAPVPPLSCLARSRGSNGGAVGARKDRDSTAGQSPRVSVRRL